MVKKIGFLKSQPGSEREHYNSFFITPCKSLDKIIKYNTSPMRRKNIKKQ